MTKFLVFAVFFVVWLDGVLGLRLSLVPGLSAKNIVLYLVVIWIVLQGALDGSRGGLFARRHDYMSLHVAFIGFILLAVVSAVACLTVLRYPDYTVEFTLWTLKAYLIDHYLFMFVFLVGLRNADEARQLARLVLIAMAFGILLWAIDYIVGADLGLVSEKVAGRMQAPIGDPIQTGTIITFFMPMMVAMAILTRGKARIFWWVTVMACFAILLATASRGPLVGLLGAVMIAAWFARDRIKAVHVAYAVAGGLLLTVLGYLALGETSRQVLYERVIGQSTQATAFDQSSGRNVLWGNAIADMAAKPATLLVGHGWKAYNVLNPHLSHNEYLEFLYNLGIFGLLLAVYVYFYAVRHVRRALARAEPADASLMIGFLVGYLSVLISIFFVNMHDPWVFVWSFTGIMLRLAAEPQPA
jgi:O-antigen ligase